MGVTWRSLHSPISFVQIYISTRWTDGVVWGKAIWEKGSGQMYKSGMAASLFLRGLECC